MNPATMAYQQPYPPVMTAPVRTKYFLHKVRIGLRIPATALAILAFILDMAGGATYIPNYYYDYGYTWPIAGSAMVSDPSSSVRELALTRWSRYQLP